MPDQVRHDGVRLFSCQVNIKEEKNNIEISALEKRGKAERII